MAEEGGKWHLKVIKVKKGRRLSLQKHKLRSELWIVAEGKAKVQVADKVRKVKVGDVAVIKKGEAHRLEGITDATIVEVSIGRHDEKDIVRLADDFGRK